MVGVVFEAVELHCFFDISQKKREKYFLEGGGSFERDNPWYKPEPRPKWCKKLNKSLTPCIACVGVMGAYPKCPHLAVTALTRAEKELAEAAVDGFTEALTEGQWDEIYEEDCRHSNAFWEVVQRAEGVKQLSKRESAKIAKIAKKWLREAGFKEVDGKWVRR